MSDEIYSCENLRNWVVVKSDIVECEEEYYEVKEVYRVNKDVCVIEGFKFNLEVNNHILCKVGKVFTSLSKSSSKVNLDSADYINIKKYKKLAAFYKHIALIYNHL